ncbi:sensor histidine kinase [Ochrobactrum sp. RH2CCR150]|uniref:sensor histidine kinase n=1 Tax=Ochrobactrum sp. RH2CCR150 TaxID=2587044 RepID=UPI0015FDA85A|nr:two-component system sensor histidine kinase TctE [Ochrobactrum sp. RH2CCR150]
MARLFSRLSQSLRAQLVSWIVVPLIVVAALNLWTAWRSSENIAGIVSDRMLTASARAIGEATAASHDAIDAVIPPVALEMFSTGYGDRVYYRVETSDGRLLAGYPDLPQPATTANFDPQHYLGTYRDRELRLVVLRHPVAASANLPQSIDVIVGVTMAGYDAMQRDLWLHSVWQQSLLIIAAGALSLLGLRFVLRPLIRLRNEVRNRKSELEAFDPETVQTELRPLVTALNQYMERVRKQMSAQRRFIQNAAHQLRTPIATLTTQASFAVRTTSENERNEVLTSLKNTAMQLSRLAAQLLTLSRAEPGSRRPRADRIDLAEAGKQVLESLAGKAFDRNIDLGFDLKTANAAVSGDGTMLREMIVNLVDNALSYTPQGGMVTLSIDSQDSRVRITVEDNGPGIAVAEREHVFERFYRVPGTLAEGSGLGLAIVREVADAADGDVQLLETKGGGLTVIVTLPAA